MKTPSTSKDLLNYVTPLQCAKTAINSLNAKVAAENLHMYSTAA